MPEADIIPIGRAELERLRQDADTGRAEFERMRRDAEDGRFASLPSVQARIDRMERWRSNHRFGDLGAPQLMQVLDAASRGDVADWAELVEFAVTTDAHLFGLYTTRITRVAQADYIVTPCKYGNERQAELAAEFCDEAMGRMQGVQNAMCELLHAIALGYSASEMLWARDATDRVNYVERLVHRHGHRFRYDLQWQLRLYDQGRRMGPRDAQGYGEMLDPRTWVVHCHQEVAGYPGIGGVMRACIWRFMFARWVEKFLVNHIEKYGSPFVYGKVPKGTPRAVRDKLLSSLESLSSDHAAVIEEGGAIVFEAAAAAAQADQTHDRYLTRAEASMTKAWLGHADAVDPGVHGSQAAVSTRASATMDPRMVADGMRLAETWRGAFFKRTLLENAHMFGVPIGRVPLPELRLKTADDEVRVDQGDLAEEQVAEGYVPEVGRDMEQAALEPGSQPAQGEAAQPTATPSEPVAAPVPGELAAASASDANIQQLALNGAQVSSLLEIIQSVAVGALPRQSGIEIIVAAFPVGRDQAERMMGEIGQGFTPAPPPSASPAPIPQAEPPPPAPDVAAAAETREAEPLPKAHAPESRGLTEKTPRTSLRSPSPLALAQQGALVGWVSSSSRASPKPSKP